MNKQTYPIPEGCKAITMEIIDNKIVTTFEPARPEFLRGDVTISKLGSVCVVDEIKGDHIYEIVGVLPSGKITFRDRTPFIDVDGSRHATPEEAQPLWDTLAKEGKRWNPETMQVEEIKKEIPRAKKDGIYWCFGNRLGVFESTEDGDKADDARHYLGNYFLTKEQAQRASDKLKSALDEFWKEELK